MIRMDKAFGFVAQSRASVVPGLPPEQKTSLVDAVEEVAEELERVINPIAGSVAIQGTFSLPGSRGARGYR